MPDWKAWAPTPIRWRYGLAADPRSQLIRGAGVLGIPLAPEAVERLLLYIRELGKWNRRVNLIARDTSPAQVVELHFLDSLTLLPLLAGHGSPVHLLDVGTGAGFPGLVLAAALPGARFTLVEPRRKRISFLGHVIRTLELANVELVADRLETHAGSWKGRFSHVTGRAVAEPAQFLPLVAPLVAAETRVMLMLARTETMEGLAAIEGGPWQCMATISLTLPVSGAPRVIATVGLG